MGIEIFVGPAHRRAGRDGDVLRDKLKIDHENIDHTGLGVGRIR